MIKNLITLLVISSLASVIVTQTAINNCKKDTCYRCGSNSTTPANKECNRCINSTSIQKDGLGACELTAVPNCVFYWFSAKSDLSGCHRCEPGFKTVYGAAVAGKKPGSCEPVGSSAIENCQVYETDDSDNSVKCYYCKTGYIPSSDSSTCDKINGTTHVGKANCLFHRREGTTLSCKYCFNGFARQGDFDCKATEIEGCLRLEDADASKCLECRFLNNFWAVDHKTEATGTVCMKNAMVIASGIATLISLFL
jgi:hypothetical protein